MDRLVQPWSGAQGRGPQGWLLMRLRLAPKELQLGAALACGRGLNLCLHSSPFCGSPPQRLFSGRPW